MCEEIRFATCFINIAGRRFQQFLILGFTDWCDLFQNLTHSLWQAMGFSQKQIDLFVVILRFLSNRFGDESVYFIVCGINVDSLSR